MGGSLRFGPLSNSLFVRSVDVDSLSTPSAELCGANERYSPPAVLFSDEGATTLIFKYVASFELYFELANGFI